MKRWSETATAVANHPLFERRTAEYYRWYPRDLSVYTGGFVGGEIHGVYVHIPFCDEICPFCPYNTAIADGSDKDGYVQSILSEIDLYSELVTSNGLRFIYIGGGTPSTISVDRLKAVLSQLHLRFGIAADAEISIEMHPLHINPDALRNLRRAGVTRVSTGIQSYDDRTLSILRCHHDAEAAHRASDTLSEFMPNSGIDLLYRCPSQTVSDVSGDISAFCERYQLSHLSLYSLYLPNERGQADARAEVEMAACATSILENAGFSHYASCATGGYDFARAGRESRYERDHWAAPQANYLGLGVGAFGFVGAQVTVNFHDMTLYEDAVRAARLPILSAYAACPEETRHRYFTLGVKALDVPLEPYRQLFGSTARTDFSPQFEYLEQSGLATVNNQYLSLTAVGRHYVDQVSEVFLSPAERLVPHPETVDLRRLERRVARVGRKRRTTAAH